MTKSAKILQNILFGRKIKRDLRKIVLYCWKKFISENTKTILGRDFGHCPMEVAGQVAELSVAYTPLFLFFPPSSFPYLHRYYFFMFTLAFPNAFAQRCIKILNSVPIIYFSVIRTLPIPYRLFWHKSQAKQRSSFFLHFSFVKSITNCRLHIPVQNSSERSAGFIPRKKTFLMGINSPWTECFYAIYGSWTWHF